jgi:hypothetical protein
MEVNDDDVDNDSDGSRHRALDEQVGSSFSCRWCATFVLMSMLTLCHVTLDCDASKRRREENATTSAATTEIGDDDAVWASCDEPTVREEDDVKPSTSKWPCSKCTFENSGVGRRCAGCGAVAPSLLPASVSSSSSSSSSASSFSSGKDNKAKQSLTAISSSTPSASSSLPGIGNGGGRHRRGFKSLVSPPSIPSTSTVAKVPRSFFSEPTRPLLASTSSSTDDCRSMRTPPASQVSCLLLSRLSVTNGCPSACGQ